MREIKPPVPALIFALCAVDMAVQPVLSVFRGHGMNPALLAKYLLVIAIISVALLVQHKRVRGPRYQARTDPGAIDFAAMVLSVVLGSLPLPFGLFWASADLRTGDLSTLVGVTVGVGFITTVAGSILAVELSPKSFQRLRQTIERKGAA